MTTDFDTVVFLGPTLPVAEASAILAARYEPPARLGSVYELIGAGVKTIVLIDGLFHNQPSIWQREIDAALAEGMTVFGASSMGALRAAELERFGMIGHGTVFDWYRRRIIDSDDEVAILHADASGGYRPLSEPLVNIRYTLQEAVREGVLDPAQRDAVLGHAKRLYYPERSYPRLLRSVRADPELVALSEPLERYLVEHRVDLKRRDAVSLLQRVARQGSSRSTTERPAFGPFRHGYARLSDAWRRRGQEYRTLQHEGVTWTLGRIWNLLEQGDGTVCIPNLGGTGTLTLSDDTRRELLFDRAVRDVAVEYVRTCGYAIPERLRHTVTERLVDAVGQASSVRDWCEACRLTPGELDERIASEAIVAWLAEAVPEDVRAATTGWVDPLGAARSAEVGLYLRVFETPAERLAARRVALAALLDECDQEVEPVPHHAWPALLSELEARA